MTSIPENLVVVLIGCCVNLGKVQNMDPLSIDPLCWPGPWTGSIKIWSGSMDPLFLLALKIVVIKDYECVPRLWYNLNSCLLLKSLYLRTAKIKIYRQKVCHSQKLELSEESLQMGSPNLFYSHVYFWQFLIFLLHYYHFFLWIILYSCFSKLRTWGCIHKLRFDDLWWHVAWRVQFR